MQVTIAEWTRRHPFRASARNGYRRIPSAGGYYGRHWGLANHAWDDVLVNQWKGKISDNLGTGPKLKLYLVFLLLENDYLNISQIHMPSNAICLSLLLLQKLLNSPSGFFSDTLTCRRTPKYYLKHTFLKMIVNVLHWWILQLYHTTKTISHFDKVSKCIIRISTLISFNSLYHDNQSLPTKDLKKEILVEKVTNVIYNK